MRHPLDCCTHCGRWDEPLTTLTPIRRPGRVKHLCPNCYEAVAEVTWIVGPSPRPARREEVDAWSP